MMWLLRDDVLEALRQARTLGPQYQPTAEEREKFAAAVTETYAARDGDAPRNMSIAGRTAEIAIEGVLTEKPDCLAMLFGGGNTTYASIRKALAFAEANADVRDIVLRIHSPGGTVEGLFETLAVLEAMTKPVRVRASQAASAAYALAAGSGGLIEAVTPASEFGSVGVVARIHRDPEVIDITSTEAPNKRPDISTDEGKALIREELDAVHELFVDAIARGRTRATNEKITPAIVNAEFGRGGIMLAEAAHKRGMIDKVPPRSRRASSPGKRAEDAEPPAEQQTERYMTREELKAKHPELYAAVYNEGKEAGVAEGAKAERDRVVAHLVLADASGDTKTAREAIEKGEGMTAAVQAKHLAAAMRKNSIDARQSDSDAAGAALDDSEKPAAGAPEKDLGDLVVERLEAQRGKSAQVQA